MVEVRKTNGRGDGRGVDVGRDDWVGERVRVSVAVGVFVRVWVG